MQKLYDELMEYSKSDMYPFHMPGHKRRLKSDNNPYIYDMTEVDGLDNLYEADGIIKDALDRVKQCYSSDKSYYLVNGSTCGILTSIFATTKENDSILMARNCHGSVYKAVYLRKLNPEYVYPKKITGKNIYGEISSNDIEKKLIENENIKVVIITSPTYEGVISDVKKIADIVHKYNKILIVDEAHGSHLGFNDYFPKSALQCGADIVIHSLHKTMLGLTQTGLLHIKGNRVDKYEISRYLGIFQTSSPSYVLMSSIDESVCKLLEKGARLFDNYVENLVKFKKNVENFTNIQIFDVENPENTEFFDFDRSKILIFIDSKNKDAKYLYDTLRDKYHLQMEMVGTNHVLAMTSLADASEGFERLYKALEDIDREIRIDEVYFSRDKKETTSNNKLVESSDDVEAVVKMSPYETDVQKKEIIDIEEAIGKVSCEYIYMYPPGVPILAPGEIITENIVKMYTNYRNRGYNIYGPRYNELEKIIVVKEEFQYLKFDKIR